MNAQHRFSDLESALQWACDTYGEDGPRAPGTQGSETPAEEPKIVDPLEPERTEILSDEHLKRLLEMSPWEQALRSCADAASN